MIIQFLSIPFFYKIGIGFFISFLFSLLLGKKTIAWLKEKGMVDYFRVYSPSTHREKKGTPSGGGVLILLSVGITFLLLGDFSNRYVLPAIVGTFCFGFLGLLDDLIKKFKRSSHGLSIKTKLVIQTIASFGIVFFIYYSYPRISTGVQVPFFHFQIELGFFYFVLAVFIILSSSNAVNISDGLDGLAAGCIIAPAISFILFSLLQGSSYISSFLNWVYLPGSRELAFFWCVLLGALLGFLKYNKYPAKMFMGGIGSESLGGALGISAILLKKEILLLIIGGVFVVEALSVILQVISYRLTGKRVFKMAPLHHHFELKGLKESQIVWGFWIASILFSVLAFLSII